MSTLYWEGNTQDIMAYKDKLAKSGELYEISVSILSLAFRELIEEYYPSLHSFDLQKVWNARLRKVALAQLTPQMWQTLKEIMECEQELIGEKIAELLGLSHPFITNRGEVTVKVRKKA